MKNICVFASGTGSNFDSIVNESKQGVLQANVVLLVSDRPTSAVVSKANHNQIDTFVFNPKDYSSKAEFEIAILKELYERNVELIVLAGYMRLIGDTLLKAYPKRILNIHPSLLPHYKGKDAVGQAMKDHATITGVTIHFVDEGMDTGDIIMQEELSIVSLNTRKEIEEKIHAIEHRIYPQVINKVLEELS